MSDTGKEQRSNSKISRRNFIKSGSLSVLGAALVVPKHIHAEPSFDIVIKGATVVDGTGAPAFKSDVGIIGDTIAAVGDIGAEQAKKIIQADGLHLSPGFIDIHTHSDEMVLVFPNAESRVYQGITTELSGNCGGSMAIFCGSDIERRKKIYLDEYGLNVDWTDVASFAKRLERDKITINHATLVGHGSMRRLVSGLENRELNSAELKTVMNKLEESMDQGAFGMSSSLEYIPGMYTSIDEIVALARIVSQRGGLYATHMRDESAGLLAAVNETIEVGRRTGVRAEISHFKAAGKPNWDMQDAAIDLVEAARADGVQIMADAYPYHAYSSRLTIYYPKWAQEGGMDSLLERLKDKDLRKKIAEEVDIEIANSPGDYSQIVIISTVTDENKWMVGKNLAEIADKWQMPPADAFLRIAEEEHSGLPMIGFGMDPANVEKVLACPLVMIGSDGHIIAPVGKFAEERPHPRCYGTAPRVLGYYCRERKIFDLPTAVKKMTSMPADQMGLKDRGRIARGMKADLVLFDAERVIDTATFDNPHQYPVGINHVLVNGVPVLANGDITQARPGRMLRKV